MQTKIDCSIAENYITELYRMCQGVKNCGNCKLYTSGGMCLTNQYKNPQKALEIVQAWSDEHPIEPVVTYLDKLLEAFPNAVLINGTPKICPYVVGLQKEVCPVGYCTEEKCKQCWNQPYKGE